MFFNMGEMSEMFLGLDANDMFWRDFDAAVHGRPFVSEDTDYPDSLPLLPNTSELYRQTDVTSFEHNTANDIKTNKLELHIKNIKKLAFEYSKKMNAEPPKLARRDMDLFINLTSIYVLYENGVYSLAASKRLTVDRIGEYKLTGMWHEIYNNHLEQERIVENLTCEMGKNPTIEIALKIIYELIPSLKSQKNKIDKAILGG